MIEWVDGEMRSVHPPAIALPQVGRDGEVWALQQASYDSRQFGSVVQVGTRVDLVRWNGESWDVLMRLGWGVNTMSGPAIDDLWFLQGGRLLHWNGALLEAPDTPEQLGTIWSPGGGLVVAASWDTLYVMEDATWAATAEGRFPAIHGTGPEDWWAVGSSVLQMHEGELLEHELPSDSPAVAVFSPAPGQAWIADENGTLHLYADGAWSTSFDTGLHVRSIHGSGPDDVWVAGLPRSSRLVEAWQPILHWGNGPGLWRWDGKAWKAPPLPFSERLGGVQVAGDRLFAIDGQGIVERGPSGNVRHHPVGLPLTRLHAADTAGEALWIQTSVGLGRWEIPTERP